jgi:hypothetical protein
MHRLLRYVLGIGVVAAALSGCTSSRVVTPADVSTIDTINQKADTKAARVRLVDGSTREGQALHLGPDSASWMSIETRARIAMPTDSVVAISFTAGRPGRGAFIGALAGALAGGILYGAASGGADFAFPYTLLLFEGPAILAGTLFGTAFEARRIRYQLRPMPRRSPR